MKKNLGALTAFAAVLSALALLIVQEIRRPWHLKAMYSLEKWAARIEEAGGVGRSCNVIDVADIFNALPTEKKVEVHSSGELTRYFPTNEYGHDPVCFSDIKLMELEYNATQKFVSGTWRCQHDDIIGEFQLTVFSSTLLTGALDGCVVGVFPASLDIPVGMVTDLEY